MAFRDVIRLNYWRGCKGCESNYGDALSPLIVSRVTGRRVVYAHPLYADMLGIGSILESAVRLWRRPLIGRISPLLVWGTGTLTRARVHAGFMNFLAVRGPSTRDLLTLDKNMVVGDPGLLAPMLLDTKPRPQFSLGIVPHWTERNCREYRELASRLPHCRIIDPTNPDVIGTTKLIASCEAILSSSLHGLIVADSFGIPNARFRCLENRDTNDWKFFDYFASVRRKASPAIDSLTGKKLKDLMEFSDHANPRTVSIITQNLLKIS